MHAFEISKKISLTSSGGLQSKEKIYKFYAVLREVDIHENQKVYTKTDNDKGNYSQEWVTGRLVYNDQLLCLSPFFVNSRLLSKHFCTVHGSSPPYFRGWDLKISDQNNWAGGT